MKNLQASGTGIQLGAWHTTLLMQITRETHVPILLRPVGGTVDGTAGLSVFLLGVSQR